jgi:hypothetical protein
MLIMIAGIMNILIGPKIVSAENSTLKNFSPPYNGELPDNGMYAWVHTDKTTGDISGWAMAQQNPPSSSAEGYISETWTADNAYLMQHQEFIGSASFHIGGDLLWTTGGCDIIIKCIIYYNNVKIDEKTLYSKHADAAPNYYWSWSGNLMLDSYITKQIEYQDDVTIEFDGTVVASNGFGDGYCSCEFHFTPLSSLIVYGNKPDLQVTGVWTNPVNFRPGDQVTIGGNWACQYSDAGAANLIQVSLYFDGICDKTNSYNILTNGQTGSITFVKTWPNNKNTYEIKVTIDENNYIDEIDNSNNVGYLEKAAPYDAPSGFISGTQITMYDGSYKNIEQVNVGDIVMGYNVVQNTIVSGRVTKVDRYDSSINLTSSYLVINSILDVTQNHLVLVNGRWIEAQNASLGDYLKKIYRGGIFNVQIQSIITARQLVATYNLEVNGCNDYIANGFVVRS